MSSPASVHRDRTSSASIAAGVARVAIFLPLLVAVCGLAAIAIAPRADGGSLSYGIDPAVTGSISAPLFEGGADAPD